MVSMEGLRTLAAQRGAPRVSIYLPLHLAGPETKKDTIRLGNLITRAEEILEKQSANGEGTERLLQPARDLLRREGLWEPGASGLALFLSSDGVRTERVTHRLPERVVVSDLFHVRPLLQLMSGDGRFHILALSQGGTRLYEATRDTIEEIRLRNAPADLEDAVGRDFEQKSLQHHALGRSGGRGTFFHGHGAGSDDAKQEIEKFFRGVDHALMSTLHGSKAPLVLAAVDYLLAIYRSISKHADIMETGVHGNPEKITVEELHTRAWEIVGPRFDARRLEAIDRYRELGAGSGVRTADRVEDVVPAAIAGRVETLFLAGDVECWGRYDTERNAVDLHDLPQPGDRELVDLAVAEAVSTGADVYVNGRDVSGPSGIAAIFRY